MGKPQLSRNLAPSIPQKILINKENQDQPDSCDQARQQDKDGYHRGSRWGQGFGHTGTAGGASAVQLCRTRKTLSLVATRQFVWERHSACETITLRRKIPLGRPSADRSLLCRLWIEAGADARSWCKCLTAPRQARPWPRHLHAGGPVNFRDLAMLPCQLRPFPASSIE